MRSTDGVPAVVRKPHLSLLLAVLTVLTLHLLGSIMRAVAPLPFHLATLGRPFRLAFEFSRALFSTWPSTALTVLVVLGVAAFVFDTMQEERRRQWRRRQEEAASQQLQMEQWEEELNVRSGWRHDAQLPSTLSLPQYRRRTPDAPPPPPASVEGVAETIFLIASVIIAGVVLFAIGFYVLWLLASLARPVLRVVIKYNFVASLLVVVGILSIVLAPTFLQRQTWKKLESIWLKLPATGGFAVASFGGFEFISQRTKDFAAVALSYSQLSQHALFTLFLCTVGVWGFAWIMTSVGRASAADENSKIPLVVFIVAFVAAWLANAGIYTLFLDAVLLTLHGHLAGA